MFTLARICNDLTNYKRQLYDPAVAKGSPWFSLPATTAAPEADLCRFDIPSLAFLLESKEKDGPLMLMKLAVEQARYATFLETVRIRGQYHQERIASIASSMPPVSAPPGSSAQRCSDSDLQRIVGPGAYPYLRNYFSDIEHNLLRGLETSKALGEELRALLAKELPGRVIIKFEEAPQESGSPIMDARARAAESPKRH